jgi:hypothetical protein
MLRTLNPEHMMDNFAFTASDFKPPGFAMLFNPACRKKKHNPESIFPDVGKLSGF